MRQGKVLSALVLASLFATCIWGGTNVQAEDTTTLDEVIVEADKDQAHQVVPMAGGLVNKTAKLGILGNKSIHEIPYTEESMNAKMIETFADPSQPLAQLLQNDPSIRSSTTSPMYTDFSMRGINMNGNHIMLNGIPSLFYQFNGPVNHIIERLDITSGPNAGVNGVSMSNNGTNSGATPAPGTINVVTKRAGDKPMTTFTESFSGRSNFGEFIDFSRRVGKDNEIGIRVMGEYMDGDLALKNAKKKERNIFVNLDRKGKTSTTNLFVGSFDLRVTKGQRWFTYNGKSGTLPHAPDSNTDYDFDGTYKWMHGWLFTLNHEKEINDNVTWFTNIGRNIRSGNKYNSGSALAFDEKGNFTAGNNSNAQNEIGANSYMQTGLRITGDTGKVHHTFSVAVDRSWAKYWNDSHNNQYLGSDGKMHNVTGSIGGSLYDGVRYNSNFAIPSLRSAKLSWDEVNTGVTFADSIKYRKWNFLLAASHKHENFKNKSSNGRNFQNDDWLPTFGITYQANDNFSVYAGQTESLSRGSVVTSGSHVYVNDGDTLAPAKSKQREIGVKYQIGSVLTTLSYFYIDQESLIDEDLGNNLWSRHEDGREHFKGVEWTFNGKPADKWTITGGLMYIDAKRHKTQGGDKDGWRVNGVADWSGVLGLIYEPNDKFGIIGRAVWSDEAYIDNNNNKPSLKTKIPGYTVFDLGMNYKTQFGDYPVTFSAMCYNVANRDYWMGRGSSTTFGLSMPRTFMLSAKVSF